MNPGKLSESIWNIGQLDAGKRSAKTGRGYKMRAGAEGFKKGKVSRKKTVNLVNLADRLPVSKKLLYL